MFSYMWEVTGAQGPAIVIGKKSGKDNIKDYLEKLGLSADNDQVTRILDVVKEKVTRVKPVPAMTMHFARFTNQSPKSKERRDDTRQYI